MRAVLPLLLIGCSAETSMEAAFDRQVPTVLSLHADGPIASVRWGETTQAFGALVPSPTGGRVLGLPQNRTLTVQPLREDGRFAAPIQVTVPHLGLPDLELVFADPTRSELADHWVAAAVLEPEGASGIAIYDGLGRAVWGWRALDEEVAASPVFAHNGSDLLALFTARDRQSDHALIRRIPLDGGAVTETFTPRAHHAFVEREGELVWLSREFPEVVFDDILGQPTTWTLMSDTIRAAPEGSTDGGAIEVDLLDLRPFYAPCGHADERTDRYSRVNLHDWSHSNSLAAVDDALWLGARHHDAVYAIDPNGGLRWTLGGRDHPVADPWSHAHFTHAWSTGALLFDNGNHTEARQSRVIELQIDPSTGASEVVWSFDPVDSDFTSWLGDARRLPGGNTLVALTQEGRLLEVAPSGEVVWEARTPPGFFVGRTRFVADLLDPDPG